MRSEQFLRRIFLRLQPLNFAVDLDDTNVVAPALGQTASCRLIFRSPEAVHRLFRCPSSLTFGEAYACGDVEVEGSLAASVVLGQRLLESHGSLLQRVADWYQVRALRPGFAPALAQEHGAQLKGKRLTRERMREAIRFHYDLPIAFWQPWLDAQLVYSCAYFESPDMSLEEAQTAKLDLICRKLRLRPGEKLLDLGCGWGGLVWHAARYYGVDATGVTLSPSQAQFANERIHASGLGQTCRVVERDLRDAEGEEQWDKIAAVGSIEHVAKPLLRGHFKRIFRLLRPGGVFLNHGMTASERYPLMPGPSFIDRYIFPDCSFVTIWETLRAAERAGFEVRDVEDLREHYALTLQHWAERFGQAREEVEMMTTAETFRIFRLYLEGSKYQFDRGGLNLHQTLLLKPQGRPSGLPLTRRDWFEPQKAG